MIGILDLGMSNLRSVTNAVALNAVDTCLESSAARFDSLSHLILPGVGHFGAAMNQLKQQGCLKAVRDFAASGRPVLGICLGMQLLADTGTEGGETEGLGLVPGTVRQLPAGSNLRVPHVGWNGVTLKRPHPILEGLKPNRDFYFVHSYVFHAADRATVLGETEYGEQFASIVGKKNVVGFQFHPEKSQANGLRLIENFCNWDGTC